MKVIALIAVAAVVGLLASGALPEGSVGGALTLAAVYLAAALAVGADEAWSSRRGVLGWIGSLVIAFAGGLIGAWAGAIVLESAIMLGATSLEGTSLVKSGGPFLYIGAIAQMVFTLAGAWGALRVVGRWR